MLTQLCFVFYVLGIRLQQVLILCENAGVIRPKSMVSAALARLVEACGRVLEVSNPGDLAGQRIQALVQNACQVVDDTPDFDEAQLLNAYDACTGHLHTLIQFGSSLSRSLSTDVAQVRTWFDLGAEIVNGEGNTPWDVPPGCPPRREELQWSLAHPEQVDSMLASLVIERDRVFPAIARNDLAWGRFDGLPPYLWGWVRIETGLAHLENAIQDAEPQATADSDGVGEQVIDFLGWDQRTFERNRWIYQQCQAGIAYTTIVSRLRRQSTEWHPISSVQGIKRAAHAYAKRAHLPAPPPRQRGRRKQTN